MNIINKKLIIVANRLPVKAKFLNNLVELEKSAGGLATGLDSLNITYEKHWIGWPGIYTNDKKEEELLSVALVDHDFHPVFLTEEDVELYYEGYSNSTLWPLFHYFFAYTRHEKSYWEAYQKVNRLFMEKVLEIAGCDDIIWVQDYHLMLLPGMIREHLPGVRIGFFLHIPFPSFELFRTLENRNEILTGLLGADLVGFHTYDYMRHFISSLYRIKGIESDDNTFHFRNRTLSVDTFPMGINYDQFNNAHKDPEVKRMAREFRGNYTNKKIVLSVDRLDYSKGLLQRLEGFRLLLQNHPEWINRVSLVMILVPSRDSVDKYHDLKTRIDETIGNLNGKYSSPGWIPIHYFYKSFSFKELSAYYYESDIALVTPLRDGMNLVSKEYVAAKADRPGVLILSEMAGSSVELSSAFRVNPNNAGEIAGALHTALQTEPEKQKELLREMQRTLKKRDIRKWAGDFIDELEKIHIRQRHISRKYLRQKQFEVIADRFRSSSNRLLILDYDGTLVPYTSDPGKAMPSTALIKLLRGICSTSGMKSVIISGRDREFLDKIFAGLNIILFAEHGAHRRIDGEWESVGRKDLAWQTEIVRIMKDVTESTPGSFVEKKISAVAWHYRNTDKWLAELRVAQLMNRLIYPCNRRHLHLMKGEKIVEVKPSEYTKGTAIRHFFNLSDFDFILAAGDDTTDEDMFDALPGNAVTIKIGKPSEKARYTVATSRDFVKFLGQLFR
jgi:trehalose 6-phosphate synthase/phosphatase